MPDMLSLLKAVDASGLESGGSVSFHHHMRNGDTLMHEGLGICRQLGLKDLHLAASALFPCHESLIPFLKDGTVSRITTAYMNGPLANFISAGGLQAPVQITTHGGRARDVETINPPDLAIVGAPAHNKEGYIGGSVGPWACGPLGYPMVDVVAAKHVVAACPGEPMEMRSPCVVNERFNSYAKVDTLGDPTQIVSGTTARKADAVGQKIAQQVIEVIKATGRLDHSLKFQAGAGSIPIEVLHLLGKEMAAKKKIGAFMSGGITKMHTDMLHEGIFDRLFNVQCFDLGAVKSYQTDEDHFPMSAGEYADPDIKHTIASQLNVAVIGAIEVDRFFDVNVTTTGSGLIMGGSGGHGDIAEGADLTIVVLPRSSKGIPRLVDRVRCVTTPSRAIDVVITEDAICVNPARPDYEEDIRKAGLKVEKIRDLVQVVNAPPKEGRIVAHSVARRGRVIDEIPMYLG